MTYDQVWWPILGICALHLTHPKCTHTHTVNTHPEQWAVIYAAAPGGAVGGSVPCSRAPQSWYWRRRECWTFTPPTYNSCRTWDSNLQPLDYESDSLTIRPQLKYLIIKYWMIFNMKRSAVKSTILRFVMLWSFLIKYRHLKSTFKAEWKYT